MSLDEASATIAISLADASGVDMNPDAANPPSPSPMITPLELLIRFSWLSAGWRMLKRTQAIAGIMGSNRASPRLSPSAISAICCAAKAGSHELKVEKIAPAMALPASEDGRFELLAGFEMVRPLGRFCMERREKGFGVGFVGLLILVELMLRHFALSIAIVATLAAIFLCFWV